jgi:hypothetical protein
MELTAKKRCLFSEREGKQTGGCVEKKEEGKGSENDVGG